MEDELIEMLFMLKINIVKETKFNMIYFLAEYKNYNLC